MILVDTSAWVEYLRQTDSPVRAIVRDLLGDELAICDAIRMEVLAGARDESHLQDLKGVLTAATSIPTVEADYEDAATLYRDCRRQGHTVRSLVDCLIAAVAIRNGVPVLHGDRDFEALARHTELEIYRG